MLRLIDKCYLQCLPLLLLQVALLFLLLSKQASAAVPHWQEDNYLTESFIEIALKREYRGSKKTKLHRWQQPLKIFIKSEAGDSLLQRQLYRVQAQHLQGITGHTIYFVDLPEQANVLVVFTLLNNMKNNVSKYIIATSNIEQVLKSAVCMASIESNHQSEIIRAVILIPVDSGSFIDCVIEELTQVLGLPNDSTAVYPSIFNDLSIDRYLTGLDYLLLKIAYHPLLKPGMNEKQVREKLPVILAELRQDGEVVNAQWRVLKNSMETGLSSK